MKKLLLIAAIAALFAISSASVKSESLDAHNKQRKALGLPDLVWSSSLARNAQSWANYLARNRKTSHSPNRNDVGENIAYGSSRSNSVTKFVNAWAEEKEDFVEGENYPNCTSTGDVDDVEHYTQMVWEKTTKVGCGLVSRDGRMYYVCQYYPAGNINGQPVYTVEVEEPETEQPEQPEEPTEPTEPTKPTQPEQPESSDLFIADSLAAHNNERNARGVASLR